MSIKEDSKSPSRSLRFVEETIKACQAKSGLSSRLVRSQSVSQDHLAWEHLLSLGVDIEKELQRIPYSIVSFSLAKSKAKSVSGLGLGSALAKCYPEGAESSGAQSRLRRLLSIDNVSEASKVLRPMLSLIHSRDVPVDHVKLLDQLLRFPYSSKEVKAQWASDFFGSKKPSVKIED